MKHLGLLKRSVGWVKVIDCYSASQKEAVEYFLNFTNNGIKKSLKRMLGK